jgi:hypothetical protein
VIDLGACRLRLRRIPDTSSLLLFLLEQHPAETVEIGGVVDVFVLRQIVNLLPLLAIFVDGARISFSDSSIFMSWSAQMTEIIEERQVVRIVQATSRVAPALY